jgi:hypothetical protein
MNQDEITKDQGMQGMLDDVHCIGCDLQGLADALELASAQIFEYMSLPEDEWDQKRCNGAQKVLDTVIERIHELGLKMEVDSDKITGSPGKDGTTKIHGVLDDLQEKGCRLQQLADALKLGLDSMDADDEEIRNGALTTNYMVMDELKEIGTEIERTCMDNKPDRLLSILDDTELQAMIAKALKGTLTRDALIAYLIPFAEA